MGGTRPSDLRPPVQETRELMTDALSVWFYDYVMNDVNC